MALATDRKEGRSPSRMTGYDIINRNINHKFHNINYSIITENNYLLLLGERRRQPLAHLVRHGVGLQLGEVVVGLLPKDNFSL